MKKTPRQRAEACFALARSTLHDGERENAISLGIKVATAAGLNLDLFDIPGRSRPRDPNAEERARRGEAANERMRQAFRETAANPSAWSSRKLWPDDEMAYARNIDEMMRDFSATLERQHQELQLAKAATILRNAGALVDRIPAEMGGGWAIRFHDGMGTATDAEILELSGMVKARKAEKA